MNCFIFIFLIHNTEGCSIFLFMYSLLLTLLFYVSLFFIELSVNHQPYYFMLLLLLLLVLSLPTKHFIVLLCNRFLCCIVIPPDNKKNIKDEVQFKGGKCNGWVNEITIVVRNCFFRIP